MAVSRPYARVQAIRSGPGRLCIKGWNATPAVRGADRLRTPLVRKGDDLEPATWEEAILHAASSLKQISSASGAHSIGVIGSAKTTNEECYSLGKFARNVLGTPNVDGACRFYDASITGALLQTTGTPASQTDLNSLRTAGSILIVGSNVMEQLAHIGSRIQDAVDNGCKVIAADPRTTRIAPQACLFMHPWPGTDLAWVRALLRTIIDQTLFAEELSKTPGFKELRSSLDDVDVAGLARACGVTGDEVARAAEILANNRPVVVAFGLGVMQQPSATQLIRALADLSILLGGSVLPLRGQNNAQGASDLGLTFDYLPGYAPVGEVQARRGWELTSRTDLPAGPGMSAVDMVRGCNSGKIRALLVFGENIALSAPNARESVEALQKAGFLAVTDMYLTETAALADVVFPACSFLEKDGTFTNIERRVQRVRKVFDPIGESKSDLEIIADLASAMGKEMQRDPCEIMREIAANVKLYENVSYEKLEETWGSQWPANGKKPRLAPIPPAAFSQDPDYAFRLIASRINYHQQTGTMSAKSHILARNTLKVMRNSTKQMPRGLLSGRDT